MRVKHIAIAGLAVLGALALQLQVVARLSAATATLGSAAAGPLTDDTDANHMNGSRFTTGALGGTVSTMGVFVGNVGAAPNNAFQLAIYADNAGSPGSLLAQSATGALVANSVNTVPVTAALTANTAYWLMYNANGSNSALNNMRYATGGTGAWSSVGVPFGTWPTTFGASTKAAVTFSIFATYTTGTDPAPTVALTAPAAGATVSGTAQLLSADAANAAGVQFKVGGTDIGAEDLTAPYSATWDTTTVANGVYSVTAVARSASGQTTTSAPVSVTVANTAAAPTVAISAPTTGAVITGSTTVTAQATNAVAVQFALDGANLGGELTSAPYTLPWNSASTSDGAHTITATARNSAGVTATATVNVTVSNPVTPPPPPPSSPTQPILVVTDPANPYTRYHTEILNAEGLRSYTTKDLAQIDAATLNQYDVVLLGQTTLSTAQVALFDTWVQAGGRLIAMRPDKKLAGLLGLSDAGSTITDTYLKIDTARSPGAGLVGETIQYHGTADRYGLNGATAVAMLYSNATTATAKPAVTMRSVGTNGGWAAAFTFDLARSVVLTRQGNPAWAGRNSDGVDGIEASEMFFGANGAPDWNDLNKALIPIADEQQRLLVNIITQVEQSRKPLPRFWYLPRELKAAIVMTGDDHATAGTAARFNDYLAKSPAGCSVANWECIRSSSYIFPFGNGSYPILPNSQAVAFQNQGFEIGVHITTNCVPWGTAQNLATTYTNQIGQFHSLWPGLSNPVSSRTHCVEWDDWATQAKVKLANGMRYDTDYYYYPDTWTRNRPGYFNGTALPMRFADLDGSVIDVYQGTTQVTDESGLDEPFAVNAMLDKAFGAEGYYTVITANEHTDSTAGSAKAESDAIITAAKARGVPIVSGRQMLQWLDSRNASSFDALSWTGSTLSFTVSGGANGLTAMLPVTGGGGTLSAISRNGANVAFSVKTIKGVPYAFFSAATGPYTASYGSTPPPVDTTPPLVSATAPANGATGVATTTAVRFTFNEALDPATVTNASAELRTTANAQITTTVTYDAASRTVILTPTTALSAGTGYNATLKAAGVKDSAGNAVATATTIGFTTAAAATSSPVGYNTIGGLTDTGDNNWMNGSKVTTGPTPNAITKMSVYVKGALSAAPRNKFRLAIYSDVAGKPGVLVAQSGEGTLVANSWNTLPVSATLAPSTSYWFIYNSNGTSATTNAMTYSIGVAGVGVWSTAAVPYGTWPASFGGATLSSARFSIYAS